MAAASSELMQEAFSAFPYGLLILGRSGEVLVVNGASRWFVGDPTHPDGSPLRCCDLVACNQPGTPLAYGCITELAAEKGHALPELRLDMRPEAEASSAWVTAASLRSDASLFVIQLRPAASDDRRRRSVPHWAGEPELRIWALGRLRVQSREGSLGGAWLETRPAQILKLLVAERHRPVHTNEIAEALWPGSTESKVRATVRYHVHALRNRLEPQRDSGGRASFVVSRQGGYALDQRRVRIDVDDFDSRARLGLGALRDLDIERATPHLEAAADIYSGDFLADEPYAAWATVERDRLRGSAAAVLQGLARCRLAVRDVHGATELLQRLTELEPYDDDVHRALIRLHIAAGRRSDAVRSYNAFRHRLEVGFGQEPGFILADLISEDGVSPMDLLSPL